MKLIVDSGATKGDWRIVTDKGELVSRFMTPGTNVSSMTADAVKNVLVEAVKEIPQRIVNSVHFYTAGIVTPLIREKTSAFFVRTLKAETVEVQDDLLGAARAALGRNGGVVAILGTGSNTCMYDGESARRKVGSGGYLLGDDGSGATIGRLFLSDYIKNLVPIVMAEDFASRFEGTYDAIVANVYHSGSPSQYLGSIAPFVVSYYYDEPYAKRLVDSSFQAFIDRSLKAYDVTQYEVGVVGGFGYACKDIFRPLAEASGIKIRSFIPSPADGLVKYHTSL